VIGSRGPLEFNPRLIMGKSATVVGIMAGSLAMFEMTALTRLLSRVCLRGRKARVLGCDQRWSDPLCTGIDLYDSGLDNGTLSPIVGHTFPLEDTSKAHVEVIEHAAGTSGKIVVHPWE
jgi:NADPH:quinone reductase-like Zn-dependent oxidoreductase